MNGEMLPVDDTVSGTVAAEDVLSGTVQDGPQMSTNDYNALRNKPSIDGIPLEGDVHLDFVSGVKGDKGEKGDPFTYEDFTPEQLEALKGDKGDQGEKGEKGEPGQNGSDGAKGEKGDPFTYEDFTPEQLEALKGDKGDKGDPAGGEAYTAEDKEKLAGIADNANNYTHPAYIAKASGLYKVRVDNTGHVPETAPVSKEDITSLGIPAQDTTYQNATATSDGLMSKEDKIKLDQMESSLQSKVTQEEVTTYINQTLLGGEW